VTAFLLEVFGPVLAGLGALGAVVAIWLLVVEVRAQRAGGSR
jgi:hypothetical protein